MAKLNIFHNLFCSPFVKIFHSIFLRFFLFVRTDEKDGKGNKQKKTHEKLRTITRCIKKIFVNMFLWDKESIIYHFVVRTVFLMIEILHVMDVSILCLKVAILSETIQFCHDRMKRLQIPLKTVSKNW